MVETPHEFRIFKFHETAVQTFPVHDVVALTCLGRSVGRLLPFLHEQVISGCDAIGHAEVNLVLRRAAVAVQVFHGFCNVVLDMFHHDGVRVPALTAVSHIRRNIVPGGIDQRH